MKVNLQTILLNRDISLYALSKKSNIAYSLLHKLANNNTKSITFTNLEIICNTLDCDIQDILILDKTLNKA